MGTIVESAKAQSAIPMGLYDKALEVLREFESCRMQVNPLCLVTKDDHSLRKYMSSFMTFHCRTQYISSILGGWYPLLQAMKIVSNNRHREGKKAFSDNAYYKCIEKDGYNLPILTQKDPQSATEF